MTRTQLEQLIVDSGVGARSAKKMRDAFERQQPSAEAPVPAKLATPTSKGKKVPVAAGHGAPSPGRKPTLSL